MREYVLFSLLPFVLQMESFRRMTAAKFVPRCTNNLRGTAAGSEASAHWNQLMAVSSTRKR